MRDNLLYETKETSRDKILKIHVKIGYFSMGFCEVKYLNELGLGHGFSSMSPLSLINLMCYNRYTVEPL